LAKIQVQGIGVYDDKTLKKKIIDMANSLSKLAKKGQWSKSSENGIRALGRMWGAYQDWARNNESVQNEATRYSGPPTIELGKLKDAIKLFQKKIKKQGHVTNARDAEHLKNLIKIYKQMGGKGVKESKLNERMKTPFMVHPTDPDQTERHFVKLFKELSKGHPHPIDYGPRESDQYDWNDRRNYTKSIEEYNKYMNRIADKLNKSLDEMNNIYKVWSKIRDKYRKIDKS
tara:strand:- start:1158 stop:1847 length:690 start_codon:yes stop_codon:yes gene_type:complete